MYTLLDGVNQNQQHPDTFEIPSREEKEALKVGDTVKLCFEETGKPSERMWVEITERNGKSCQLPTT